MLLDIITGTLSAESDMEVVGTATSDEKLIELAVRANPDVVVCAHSHTFKRGLYDGLLYRRPHLRVLEIIRQGRRGFLCELHPSYVSLGEMSATVLLDAIRAPRGQNTLSST